MVEHANNAFIGHSLQFDALLQQLAAHRAKDFGVDAKCDRDWGEVGSLSEVNNLLERAVAFIEGREPKVLLSYGRD